MLWKISLMMQECATFFYVVFVKLCEAVLLCLSKTPDWSNEELKGQEQGRRKKQVGLAGRENK